MINIPKKYPYVPQRDICSRNKLATRHKMYKQGQVHYIIKYWTFLTQCDKIYTYNKKAIIC